MDTDEFEMTPLSAKQRLAISRYAITKHMSRGRLDELDDASDDWVAPPQGVWGKVKFMARSWWRNHPANYAVQLARPSLEDYAVRQPFKLVGIAAAVGAASMVIRPWRLISLTTLVLAPLKSSKFTSAAVAMLSTPNADGP